MPALLILGALAVPGYGGTFQLGVLIQAGFPATGAGNWEFGAGNTSGSPSVTNDAAPYWANNASRLVEIEYQKATNDLEVRLYQNGTNTSAFNQVDFNPTGGSLIAGSAIWTIPAASFFVTATSGPIPPTAITLSNITLTGISGALTILQPMLQTTLGASRGANGATTTITQTQDVIFQGDSTGSWLLTGTLNLKGFAGPVGASGSDLAFGFGGTANGAVIPEPSALSLVGLGMAGLVLYHRRRNVRP